MDEEKQPEKQKTPKRTVIFVAIITTYALLSYFLFESCTETIIFLFSYSFFYLLGFLFTKKERKSNKILNYMFYLYPLLAAYTMYRDLHFACSF